MSITRVPTRHGAKIFFNHRRCVCEGRDVLFWSKGNILIFPMIQIAKKMLKKPLDVNVRRIFVVDGMKLNKESEESLVISDEEEADNAPQNVQESQPVVQSTHEEISVVSEEIEENPLYKPPPIWHMI